MKDKLLKTISIATLLLAAGITTSAHAAYVRASLSPREGYVGQSLTLTIVAANGKQIEPPTIPEIDGLTIRSLGPPSRSTQITTINGRTETTTAETFSFEITPQKSGSFQLPAIAVRIDGVDKNTDPIPFVASKSETGDLAFVEITGKQREIYVGQAVDLTLKIWLRPYIDRKAKITLSASDMWRLISDRSEWGPFTERLQQLADQGQRPGGKEVLRKDRDGAEHSYYLYQVGATIYPKRPGKIDADGVKIVIDYPTALGRARDPIAGLLKDFQLPGIRTPGLDDDDSFSPFAAQLVVQSARPLTVRADVEPINVLAIPTADQPAGYRGAVGKYQVAVEATPTHVKAGDPINLLIGITGTGPMELVQAPPLADIAELTKSFKVPNSPLAGFVKGGRKIFSTSIRPLREGVTEIPSIPFSYFDPTTGKFVTVHSSPVSIQVDPADMLALDGIVHGDTNANTNPSPDQRTSTPSAASTFTNFTGNDLLNNQSAWTPNLRVLLILFCTPPLAVLALTVVRSRESLVAYSNWFGSFYNRSQKQLAAAQESAEIKNVLLRVAAHYCKSSHGSRQAEALVGALRIECQRDLATSLERLLQECDAQAYARDLESKPSLEGLKQKAQQWINNLQAASSRPRPVPTRRAAKSLKSTANTLGAGSTTSSLISAVICSAVLLLAHAAALATETDSQPGPPSSTTAPLQLTGKQQYTLLQEANDLYSAASSKQQDDVADAKLKFTAAAEKYQLLVDSGITNARLDFNLGNAYFQQNETPRAIANYYRALKIEPTLRAAQLNLVKAQHRLAGDSVGNETASIPTSLSGFVDLIAQWIKARFSPPQLLFVAVTIWCSIWATVALRIAGYRLPWKSAALAGVIATACIGVVLVNASQAESRKLAIVVEPKTSASQEARPEAALGKGQVVELLQNRGDSARVRTADGQEIWIPAAAIVII